MRTIKPCNRNVLGHFWIVNILLLLMGSPSLHAEQSVSEQEMDCTYSSSPNENIAKEKIISTLVKSDIFKEFSKRYPKTTKFAFPLEMVAVQDSKKCIGEVTVYVDETDHYLLVGSFVVKGGNRVMISKINE